MTLIVEDGTGLPNAEAYISVADADAYHSAMGNAEWTGADAAKEAALRRATQYLDSHYKFRMQQLTTDQRLAWPRETLVVGNKQYEWPVREVREACAELALRALTGTLFVDQADRAVTSETVGPISVSYSASRLAGQTRFIVVDQLLAPLMAGGTMTAMRIERA